MNPRICKECGKMFVPKSNRQFYCKDDHFRACPICGTPVLVKNGAFSDPPRCCSEKCKRLLMEKTSLERYGIKDAANTQEALKKRRKTNLERYGVEDAGNRPEAKEKRRKTNLERYGVENGGASEIASKHRKQTNLERYGVESVMQVAEIHARAVKTNLERYGVENVRNAKPIIEKIKSTNMKKYGVPWAISSSEVRRKSDRTNLQRYGTLYSTQLDEIQKKIKSTCLQKYGVRSYFQTEEFKERLRETMLERYGVIAPISVPEIKERIEKTNLERYGVKYAFLSEESIKKCQRNCRIRISSINKSFGKLLDELNIEYSYEYFLEGKWYDICIPEQKVLLEINPTYTHSVEPSFYYPNGNDNKYYHRDKTLLAEKHGYRCIHVFDWDSAEDIMKLLQMNDKVLYARNCEVTFIDTGVAEEFMNINHIQHSVSGQIVCIGLIHENTVVAAMTFGVPRYNSKYQFELLRLASSWDTRVVGGASKMFKYFIDNVDPQSIISYCNRAKFTGNVYNKLGMKLLRKNPPSRYWSKDDKVISSMLLQQRGYDQLFGTHYGKGTSNEDLMRQNEWRSVYDCGQDVYIWVKS